MGAKPKNSIKMYTFLSGFALLLILFVGHAFADDCIDIDGDEYGDIITNSSPCIDQPDLNCTCGDCNDDNPDTYPGAEELCGDYEDNNCNGLGDCEEIKCCGTEYCPEGEPDWWFDGDYDNYTVCENDCDDGDASINPGAPEICNNTIDDDCDGATDCADNDCENDPICDSEIPEFPIGYIIPIFITLFTAYKLNNFNPTG